MITTRSSITWGASYGTTLTLPWYLRGYDDQGGDLQRATNVSADGSSTEVIDWGSRRTISFRIEEATQNDKENISAFIRTYADNNGDFRFHPDAANQGAYHVCVLIDPRQTIQWRQTSPGRWSLPMRLLVISSVGV